MPPERPLVDTPEPGPTAPRRGGAGCLAAFSTLLLLVAAFLAALYASARWDALYDPGCDARSGSSSFLLFLVVLFIIVAGIGVAAHAGLFVLRRRRPAMIAVVLLYLASVAGGLLSLVFDIAVCNNP